MSELGIFNKSLMIYCEDRLPEVGHLVVAYSGYPPYFAMRLDINGESEWFRVTFNDDVTDYELIDPKKPVRAWIPIAFVVELGAKEDEA